MLITAAGLTLRFYLERLQLLLVPRLASVLVLVILLMLAISLLSGRLGLDRGFSVALFPIVILTMVIEHMSVIWEESGPGSAIKEAVGSLFVATVGYLIMTEEHLTHLIFLFPELLLLLLATFQDQAEDLRRRWRQRNVWPHSAQTPAGPSGNRRRFAE